MRSRRISINGKNYIRYDGSSSELVSFMQEGDLVTLLRRSKDGSEVAKIIGVVNSIFTDLVTVTVAGFNQTYVVSNPNIKHPASWPSPYMVTCVKRPIENMMPDGPGFWRDKRGCVWAVEGEHEAAWQIYDENGRLNIRKAGKYANYLTDYAPFTKLELDEA